MTLIRKATRCWRAVATRQALCIAVCGLLPLVVRVLLLPFCPIPVPATHDEFSYLLAAETFAQGRRTNPTPPLWVHFETFHEMMRPTYMSMYPPGQGALLAAGKMLFGQPWWAVWLSVGLMCSALSWMLYAWLPPGWALLGGIFAVLQFGVVHYWMNSYWGGSLCAIGGCLTLGAFPRLTRRVSTVQALLLGLGLGIIANTRPYEGLWLGAVVAAALCIWFVRQPGMSRRRILFAAGLPFLLALVPFVAATLIEARAVTGSAWTFPHDYARRGVAVSPTFVFQTPRPIPAYHHDVMRRFYVEWEPAYEDAREWGTLRGLIPGIRERARIVGSCFFPDRIYLPIALLSLMAAGSRRIRFLGICVIAAFVANATVNWLVPHYLAPVFGALMAVHVQFLRYVRAWNERIFLGILALLVALFGYRYSTRIGVDPNPWARERASIIHTLENTGRRHLVFVRYSATHILQNEWVFNGPDIPSQTVILARAMTPSRDKELVDFYRDRQVWVVDADAQPPMLATYTPTSVHRTSESTLTKRTRIAR